MRIVRTLLIIVVIMLVLAIITVIVLFNWPTGEKYPSGKDTMYSFGDGTYQILRNSVDKVNLLMCSDPPQTVIVKVVNKYIDIKETKTAYVIGDKSYVIVKYKDKAIQKVQDLNVLSNDDRKIFERME